MSSGSESDGAGGGAPAGGYEAILSGCTGSDPAAGSGPGACELVTLITLYDPVEAEIIVGKLRSAGIAAYAHHDAMSVVYGLTIDGFGRQDIVVRAEDLPEAQAALERAP